MVSQDQETTLDQKTESKEASEILSHADAADIDTSFEDAANVEIITVGNTTVKFIEPEPEEPTAEQRPLDQVPQANTGFIGQDFFTSDDQWAKTVIGELPGGKVVQVVKRAEGQGYEIQYQGGNIPAELQGWFTTYEKAEGAARVYLASKWEESRPKA